MIGQSVTDTDSTSAATAAPSWHFSELRGHAVSGSEAPGRSADSLQAMLDTPGSMAPYWRHFFASQTRTAASLDERLQALQRHIRDNDVGYNVHSGDGQVQRPWSLDLFPLLLPTADWQQIERGVLQRTRLLDRVMADVYGPQQLLHEGLLPAALVLGHPDYIPGMQGVQPASGVHVHVAAFDLSRDANGHWWVVSQRLQAPSGLGYMLENRHVVAQQFPQALDRMRVQRLPTLYRALIASLRRRSPAGERAHIALLTPGPFNETYFEQAYLARYLGISLVEGSDLTVRDRKLYLKTLHGLEQVDVLIKRVDDQYLDPLELRPESRLGIPGLLQAIRAGNVIMSNLPGTGFLESSAILGFLPALGPRLLGEELLLPALHTWWCGEQAVLSEALAQMDDCVIKATYPAAHPGGVPWRKAFDPVLSRHLDAEERQQWVQRILAQGEDYTIQRYLPPSSMPVWRADGAGQGGQLGFRPALLRVFCVADAPGEWRVVPGGLVRLVGDTGGLSSMRSGGSSADVWVQAADGATETGHPPGALQPAGRGTGMPTSLRGWLVTSRAADNLFWMGRYTERVETSVATAQLVLNVLSGEERASPALLQWLDGLLRHKGLLPEAATRTLAEDPEACLHQLIDGLAGVGGPGVIRQQLSWLHGTASRVRDRLAADHWQEVRAAEQGFIESGERLSRQQSSRLDSAQHMLRRLAQRMTAITGSQLDRMTRDDGWIVLSAGRMIERLVFLAHALDQAFLTQVVREEDGFEAVLALFDSTITFHAFYQHSHDLTDLLQLLVHSRENPRTLGWVAYTLERRMERLQRGHDDGRADLRLLLPKPGEVPLAQLSQADSQGHHGALHLLLQQCMQGGLALSEALTQRYFTHTSVVTHQTMRRLHEGMPA